MAYSGLVDHRGAPLPSLMAAGPEYESASTSRRLGDWGVSGIGPNSALSGPLSTIRSRARQVLRNNPTVSGGVDAAVSNLVGTDISPHWEIEDQAERELLQDLWSDSQQEMDFNGIYDFYGQVEQVAMAQYDGGECLARFRPMPASSGLLVPLQIQLMEGDHLDAAYHGIAPNGNEIRQGIEWTREGKRAAYWLYTEHPGEMGSSYFYSGERVRVPAADILHVFRPRRIGQNRGCPWLGPSLTTIYELEQFDDATLVRKKVAALFGVLFKTPAPTQSGIPQLPGTSALPAGISQGKNAEGVPVVALEPGLSARLKPGEEPFVVDPADVGDNYLPFVKNNWRQIARPMGITYEQLTGDLEGVSFSSIRAGLIEIRRLMEMLQVRILIHQYCRPVVRRWLDTAVLSGAWDIAVAKYMARRRYYYRIKWQPDGWDYVDPVKDRIAEQMDVRNGFDSRTAIVGRRGRDAWRVEKEIAADNQRADAAGLILDSDPRHTEKSGAIQTAETATAKEAVANAE